MTPTLQLSHRNRITWIAIVVVTALVIGGHFALWKAHAKSQATEVARIDCQTVTSLVEREVKTARTALSSADKETTNREWTTLNELLNNVPECNEAADSATMRTEIHAMRAYPTQLQQAKDDLLSAGESVEWSTVEEERDKVVAEAEELLTENSELIDNLSEEDYENPLVAAVAEAYEQIKVHIELTKASASIATVQETTDQLRSYIETLRVALEEYNANQESDDESISPEPPRVERPSPVRRQRSQSNYYRPPSVTPNPPSQNGGSSSTPAPSDSSTSTPSSPATQAPEPSQNSTDVPDPAPEPNPQPDPPATSDPGVGDNTDTP
ncbi:MAG: hypothetical protein Q4P71_04140 [Actinomycetaceae bacterium]|nr:hypothetical protein [Actinomycetaceae bacterium]